MLNVNVLAVEDERILGLFLRRELVKLGYNVVGVATSGSEALEMIENFRPDIILMDINIDGRMDGIDTAKLIPASFMSR